MNQEALQKVLMEVDAKIQTTQNEMSTVNQLVSRRTNDLKLKELTMKELAQEPSDKPVWEGVGKMFVAVPKSVYEAKLQKEESEIKDELKSLDIKKKYLNATMDSAVKGMNDILGTAK